MKLDDAIHRHPFPHSRHHGKAHEEQGGEGTAETEAGRHGAAVHGAQGGSEHPRHGSEDKSHEVGQAEHRHDKEDQQHRRDDVFDRHGGTVSLGEKEGLKTNPELKNRQAKDPRPVDPAHQLARKSEHDKREERYDALSVPNCVFGQDRVTLSPEVQMVPAVTRKSEAVGAKRSNRRSLQPGLNGLAKKANPATPPAFAEFLSALVKNYS